VVNAQIVRFVEVELPFYTVWLCRRKKSAVDNIYLLTPDTVIIAERLHLF